MNISDERLGELKRLHASRRQDAVCYSLYTEAQDEQDVIDVLNGYQSLRRRDAAIEKAFDDPNYELWISRGKRFEITLYDTAGERQQEVYGDTFAEALSALAAGLEGEKHA